MELVWTYHKQYTRYDPPERKILEKIQFMGTDPDKTVYVLAWYEIWSYQTWHKTIS